VARGAADGDAALGPDVGLAVHEEEQDLARARPQPRQRVPALGEPAAAGLCARVQSLISCLAEPDRGQPSLESSPSRETEKARRRATSGGTTTAEAGGVMARKRSSATAAARRGRGRGAASIAIASTDQVRAVCLCVAGSEWSACST
jgi:hypothetical protein